MDSRVSAEERGEGVLRAGKANTQPCLIKYGKEGTGLSSPFKFALPDTVVNSPSKSTAQCKSH